MGSEYIEDNNVITGIYRRAIIVALMLRSIYYNT